MHISHIRIMGMVQDHWQEIESFFEAMPFQFFGLGLWFGIDFFLITS